MAALICCLTAPATTEIYTLSLHDALPILIERPALAKRERIRRRWEILVLGQGREPQHLGALGVELHLPRRRVEREVRIDRKSTRLNSSHTVISYAVFCLKKKSILSMIVLS